MINRQRPRHRVQPPRRRNPYQFSIFTITNIANEFVKDVGVEAEDLEDGLEEQLILGDAEKARGGGIDIEQATRAIAQENEIGDFIE